MIGRGHRGRVDRNQKEIVAALRKVGATVVSLSRIGDGCPDLLVGYRGCTLLLEVKDGQAPPSKRLLTEDEMDFQISWMGAGVFNVGSVEEALKVVTNQANPGR
jgi:Holliday junction resolvase